MKLAKGSASWILIPLFFSILSLLAGLFVNNNLQIIMYFLSFLLFILTLLFIIFFRDPNREIGKGIVAVADGKIRSIQKKQDDYVGNSLFISTFMNIYNVHVNRVPIDGTVSKIIHIPGSNLPAFTKESERNERIIYQMETSIGPVKIIQIAGTLARRIIPYIHKSDMVKKGQKLGIIRLGSRVDIYLPANAIKKNIVEEGQFVKAGVDCLAEIHD